jgi:hypothetical protein
MLQPVLLLHEPHFSVSELECKHCQFMSEDLNPPASWFMQQATSWYTLHYNSRREIQ